MLGFRGCGIRVYKGLWDQGLGFFGLGFKVCGIGALGLQRFRATISYVYICFFWFLFYNCIVQLNTVIVHYNMIYLIILKFFQIICFHLMFFLLMLATSRTLYIYIYIDYNNKC